MSCIIAYIHESLDRGPARPGEAGRGMVRQGPRGCIAKKNAKQTALNSLCYYNDGGFVCRGRMRWN
jgi:hypothetical protein